MNSWLVNLEKRPHSFTAEKEGGKKPFLGVYLGTKKKDLYIRSQFNRAKKELMGGRVSSGNSKTAKKTLLSDSRPGSGRKGTWELPFSAVSGEGVGVCAEIVKKGERRRKRGPRLEKGREKNLAGVAQRTNRLKVLKNDSNKQQGGGIGFRGGVGKRDKEKKRSRFGL